MFRNVYFDKWKNVIHLWETVNNKRIHKEINWIPYVYVKTRGETEIKTIFGDSVEKKEFNSFNSYKNFIEANQSSSFLYEDNVKSEIQFLCEYYSDIEDDQLKQVDLRTLIFDIEVYAVKIDHKKSIKININGQKDFFRYKEFKKLYPNIKNISYFDDVKMIWIENEELDKAFSIVGGFPEPNRAEWPISLIACYDSFNNKTYAFGMKEYNGEYLNEPWFEYLKFDSEEKLLKAFYLLVNKLEPDIITGWNSNGFDIPYIINRALRLFQDSDHPIPEGSVLELTQNDRSLISKNAKQIINLLSPIGVVTWWPKTISYKQIMLVDIAGVSLIDYRDLYKGLSKQLLNINLEKYSLEVVSRYEFEKGKKEYSEYNNLIELYEKNFSLYTDYCVTDVKRVKQIQEKRKFIQLIQTLSLLTKCPIKYYEAVTNLIEGVFLTYYRRNNLCAEKFVGGVKEQFEAAYVKKPYLGQFKDIIDLDITSSYPHGMITLNMGNETYYGMICNFLVGDVLSQATEEVILEYVRKREFPPFEYTLKNDIIKVTGKDLEEFNNNLKNGKFCISPNGVIFRTDIQGTIAAVEKNVFNKRKEYKKVMIEKGKIRDSIRSKMSKVKNNEELKKLQNEYEFYDNEYDRFKSLQIALKLIINSIYGAISVPYYRGYNLHIAEAICSVGRHAVKAGEKFSNEVMNKPELSEELLDILNELRNLAN